MTAKRPPVGRATDEERATVRFDYRYMREHGQPRLEALHELQSRYARIAARQLLVGDLTTALHFCRMFDLVHTSYNRVLWGVRRPALRAV